MMRGGGAEVQAPLSTDPLFTALRLVVLGGTSLVGVAFARNSLDSFRIPKLALCQAEAIVCLALMLMLMLWRGREVIAELRPYRVPLAIAAAALLWTAIASLASTNRTLSIPALIWVASCAAIFTATLLVARRGSGFVLAYLPLIAAAINAIIALAQRAGYSPTVFTDQTPDRLRISALIGNPNDVGVYLFFCSLAALALAVTWRGRRRWYDILTLLLIIALLTSQTASALIAFVSAALLMTVMLTRRVKFAAALVLLAVIIVMLIAPFRQRALFIAQQLREGSLSTATSLRIPAYLVAWRMFAEHPITGAGPGTYGWWYLPHKMQLNVTHPDFGDSIENFGEAHNDHLQTLAVSGLPGYLIFLAALISLGAISLRPAKDDDVRARFARVLALPLAGGFAVVALAQFPLELASTSSVIIHFSALCCAWAARR